MLNRSFAPTPHENTRLGFAWKKRWQISQVQLSDYLLSWENYCRLFDALLDCRDTNFVITEEWAFDLVHEFVYQFQSFCQMRGQVRNDDDAAVVVVEAVFEAVIEGCPVVAVGGSLVLMLLLLPLLLLLLLVLLLLFLESGALVLISFALLCWEASVWALQYALRHLHADSVAMLYMVSFFFT